MGLIDRLGTGPVGLDTAVFIYYIEEHPRYLSILDPLFAGIDAGRWVGVTSAVTLLEVLVAPYRAGDAALAARYEALLTRSRSLHLVDLDRPLLRSAAALRAITHIRTPDALQLAAVLRARCTAYLTNDRRLPSLPGLRVLQLGDYAPAR